MASGKRTRIADIAARLGVSTATVSRAISGKGYVKEDLAERIRGLAVELNYGVPDNPAGKRVWLVASNDAMIDFQRSQFTMYVLEGLQDRARSLGIAVEQRVLDSLEGADPDLLGALFLTLDDAALGVARGLPFPTVLVNGDDPQMQIGSVAPCNRSAAALATRHLWDLGHRRVAFVSRPGRRTIQRRLEGVRDVLGAAFDPDLMLNVTDWTAEAAQAAVEAALSRGLDFTAVVTAGDVLATGVLIGLQNAGLRVPEDVSVVGIDGLPQGEFLYPPLTSVTIPMRAIGAVALDTLCTIARLKGTDYQMPVARVELACSLTVRGSTGPVQASAARQRSA